ncbi:phosphate transport system substrate-binding protein [Azospirillum agricola]|uniref:substrate-binding domain-containing protein n=1 Tax=Azospirillum agricola TaxID=1720247 RepID=UPI001AE144BF|nr:substrate-binding domain-containing protein [Azospirillum agricola]MBP2232209.1 phosphate transport system substrate-binding protein [Azospirillum agricola]
MTHGVTHRLFLASALAAAALLGGCQFPGVESPRQTAALTPPPAPRPPPEERGIWIVGSPALRGPVQDAAAKFGGGPDTRPRLVAGGTAAGFRAFCAGVGLEHPDMVAADRPATAAEIKRCRAKGITVSEYDLGPKRFLYVKDAHLGAVPGVRDFVGSWGIPGKPVNDPTTGS